MADQPLLQLTKFRLIYPLGGGPSGPVYKARRLAGQDIVAVKTLTPTAGRAERFRVVHAAAERAHRLDHPHAVRTLGFVQDGDVPCLIMAFAEGESLGRALQRNVRFGPERAYATVRQVAEALEAGAALGLHHGALHPGQILLDGADVRVLGIGLAEILPDRTTGLQAGGTFSPLLYAAPEILDRGVPSVRADLCSLGLILYHLLTGYPPYRGDRFDQLVRQRRTGDLRWPRGASEDLDRAAVLLVERLTAPEPTERPADFSELLGVLDVCARAGASGKSTAAGEVRPAIREDADLPGLGDLAPETPAPAPVRARAGRWTLTLATIAVFLLAIAVGIRSMLGPVEKQARGESRVPRGGSGQRPGAAHSETGSLPSRTASPSAEKTPKAGASQSGTGGAQTPSAVRRRQAQSRDQGRAAYEAVATVLNENDEDPIVRNVARTRLEEIYRKHRDSPWGLRAKILAHKIAQQSDSQAKRLFEAIETRARRRVEEDKFAEAIGIYRELPQIPDDPRWQRKADEAARRIRDELAPTAFARVVARAQAHRTAGRLADARALFARVADRFGLEPWVSRARTELERIGKLEEERAVELQAERERQRREALRRKLPDLFRQVRADCYGFRYDRALRRIDTFAGTVRERPVAGTLADYAMAVKLEQWFFLQAGKRLAGGLKEAMILFRDTGKSLAISKIDEKGLELKGAWVDEKGLHYKPEGPQARLPWERIPDGQILRLFKIAMDPRSGDEILGLAVMAFHRGQSALHDDQMANAVAVDPMVREAALRYQKLFVKVEKTLRPRRRAREKPDNERMPSTSQSQEPTASPRTEVTPAKAPAEEPTP